MKSSLPRSPRFTTPWRLLTLLVGLVLTLSSAPSAYAQAGAHDPSRMVRNTDGRYWIFTTGDGVYAMSSSNADFTNWRTEPTVFPHGVWPSWIGQYVTGFGGTFWAPDVIVMNGKFYCYYSCAGQGAPAAVGVATATNLAGPWTDQGMVVAGNNCIDPAPMLDGTNLWLSYGNWQSGIDIVQLSTSNGKRQGTGHWDPIPGQVEGPYLMKNGSFYYLFFQRGLCCSGLSSTYYVQVGRSSSVTGPYVDQNGVALTSNGGTTFLPNQNGRFVGPGHVGYGEGKLTYHFYDGNDNGAPKLWVNTLSFVNGWPVAGGTAPPSQPIANGTYSLRNRASGKMLDNIGATGDGTNVGQFADGSSNNQRWVVTFSSGYYRLSCVTGGKFLDSLGHAANDTTVGQWTNSPSPNQQWTVTSAGSGYYKVVNRANGLCLDTGGFAGDSNPTSGPFMEFWGSGTSTNQQWQFVAP